jgi:hypothetical protein
MALRKEDKDTTSVPPENESATTDGEQISSAPLQTEVDSADGAGRAAGPINLQGKPSSEGNGSADKPPARISCIQLDEVLEKFEYPAIKERREAVGLTWDDESKDLVGLALSGGGVRSSMFNLGVLQGLHSTGMLRHIDYVSTVSGGGFIGGFLTAQLNRINQEHRAQSGPQITYVADGGCTKSHPLYDEFPLRPKPEGQNSAVINLTRHGDYLNAPFELGLRVVCGVALHLLIIATSLIAVCAGLACLWRLPDMIDVGYWVAQGWVWVVTLILLVITSLFFSLRVETEERRYFGPGTSRHRLLLSVFYCFVLTALALLAIWSSGGFSAFHRDWYYSSDVVRALVPLVVVVVATRFAWLRRRWRMLKSWNRREQGPASPQSSAHRSAASKVRSPGLFGKMISAFWHILGLRTPDANAQGERLEQSVRFWIPRVIVGAVMLSLLTMLSNGDTDLGYGLGGLIGRFIPGIIQEHGHYKSYLFHIRNDRPVADWLGKITQSLLLIQIVSGVLPLLLPRQFVLSGQAPSNTFKGVLYRFVVLVLMGSVPVLVASVFLRENISGALPMDGSIGPPIYRLQVCRDPWSGAYGNLISHDQWARFRWCLLGVSGFLLLNALVDLNRTSLHQFYRERLKRAYFGAFGIRALDPRRIFDPKRTHDPTEEDGLRETRLFEIGIEKTGAPYHLVAATMAEIRPGEHMLDAGCGYIFSPRCCGWVRHHPLPADISLAHDGQSIETNPSPPEPGNRVSRFVATTHYGGADGTSEALQNSRGLRLIDALAISGAAISPTQAVSLTDSIVLLTVNARLGQWLPNPARTDDNRFFDIAQLNQHGIPKFTIYHLIKNSLNEPQQRKCCFLTDGAHHDNLGLEPLFDRGCRLIILSDASHDPDYTFSDLSKVLRRLRANRGIRFWLAARLPEPTPSSDLPKDKQDQQQEKRVQRSGRTKAMTLSSPSESCDAKLDGQTTHSPQALEGDFEPGDFRVPKDADPGRRSWSFFGEPPTASDLKGRLCVAHHIVFRFQYPPPDNKVDGFLVVLKPSLTGDEDRFSPGLLSYARAKADFPMDPDLRQNFDESQCEFYRMLGVHVARCMFQTNPKAGEKFTSPEAKEIAQRHQHEVYDRIADCTSEPEEFKDSLWCHVPSSGNSSMIDRYGIEDFKEGVSGENQEPIREAIVKLIRHELSKQSTDSSR